ncbi:MAG: alpha/beta fold hydrolase [Candidatus Bipolaricaulis sp.]|nr:alpha/beta fold hydrolase [Candidatus Bipolaricaulis sp.]
MEEKVFIDCAGRRLCATHRVCGASSRMLVIMAHGGPGGDKRGPLGLFDVLAGKLEEELGLSSLRFDFIGYGESDGTPLDMTIRSRAEELGCVVEWARDQGYGKLALVAESLGASVALKAERPEIDVLVFLWPAVVLSDTDLKAYLSSERQAELADRGYLLEGSIPVCAEFVRECRDEDLVPALGRIHAPTLIVHGDADQCVPVAQAKMAYERIQAPKKLVVVPGGGHSLGHLTERARVLEATLDWLKTHLL